MNFQTGSSFVSQSLLAFALPVGTQFNLPNVGIGTLDVNTIINSIGNLAPAPAPTPNLQVQVIIEQQDDNVDVLDDAHEIGTLQEEMTDVEGVYEDEDEDQELDTNVYSQDIEMGN